MQHKWRRCSPRTSSNHWKIGNGDAADAPPLSAPFRSMLALMFIALPCPVLPCHALPSPWHQLDILWCSQRTLFLQLVSIVTLPPFLPSCLKPSHRAPLAVGASAGCCRAMRL